MGVHDEPESEDLVRGLVQASLERVFDTRLVEDLLDSHLKMLAEFRRGDPEAALNTGGKFVEHVLRAIEQLRTGTAPSEIKSVTNTVKTIEADGALPESLRLLVPRIASSMLFDVRSKRGAAHVKEIDPRTIDATLAVQAASWILAEFLRLYHMDDEVAVSRAMAALMSGNVPLIEEFDGEVVVTTPLAPDVETLLIVAAAEPDGIDRKGLGVCVKQSTMAVTRAVQKLEAARHIHKTKSGVFHITGPGEQTLVKHLAAMNGVSWLSTRRGPRSPVV